MNCGNWGGFWGYPFYPGNIVWMALHLAVLAVIVWAAVTVVNRLAAPKAEKRGKEDSI